MNIAIIGCSGMGRIHAAAATANGARVTVCADARPGPARALARAHGARAYTDGFKALARPEVDAVVIATPTPHHLPYIEAAAKAGKAIFCEKPFCRTAAECKRAIAAARKARVKLFVGHVVRYFHEFEALRARVAAGVIGAPGYAKLYRGGMFPGGPKSWFADYEASGGVTLDCMIHDLDWLRYVFGEPERIFCQTLQRRKPVLMDFSQATVRMRDGLIATVIGSWAHPAGFRVKAEICGSAGMLAFDSADAPVTAHPRAAAAGPSMIVPESPVEKSPYALEWEDFLAWLDTDRTPRVTPEDGLRAVAMAEAALKSAATGRPAPL